MRYILSILLLISLSHSCELEEFIQELKKNQENSKLNNYNTALIKTIKDEDVKTKVLLKNLYKDLKKEEKREGDGYEY